MRKRMNVLYADERMLAGSMDLWEDSPVWIAVPGDGAGAAGGGGELADPWQGSISICKLHLLSMLPR